MGKNISVYLDDETLRWLDEYRKINKSNPISRGKALQELLIMIRAATLMVAGMVKAKIAMQKSLE